MKIYLTLMCGPGSLDDLKELWEPISEDFDGLCAVYFGNPSDLEANYLELNKKGGKIIYLPYVSRHDMARNVCVHNGIIQEGDWVLQFDTLERVPKSFSSKLNILINQCITQKVNALYYYGKVFLYAYHESVSFQGSPHEGFTRHDRSMTPYELSSSMPNESEVRLNVRPIKRSNPFHFVDHYLKYYVEQPWGSNHCLLGIEKNGDPNKLFPLREARRLTFREYCRIILCLPLKLDAIKNYMMSTNVSSDFKQFVRDEKILNDAWRYHVLGKRDFRDDHDHKNMVEVI